MLLKIVLVVIAIICSIVVVDAIRLARRIELQDAPNLTRVKPKRNRAILFSLLSLCCIVLGIFLPPPDEMHCAYAEKIQQIQDHPSPFQCVPGTITIDGSTALQPLVSAASRVYMSKCPLATIKFGNNNGSLQGLADVEEENVQIGDSDVLAPSLSGYKNLVDHPVVAIVYVVIVNPSVHIDSLLTNQIQNIYKGTYQNWDQMMLPSQPVTAYTRDTSSGSWETFSQYVLLGGSDNATPAIPISHSSSGDTNLDMIYAVENNEGAIGYAAEVNAEHEANDRKLNIVNIDGYSPHLDITSGQYKFWNIGHMYTKFGRTSPLADAFINYMSDEENIRTLMTVQDGYVPLSQVVGLLGGHCPVAS